MMDSVNLIFTVFISVFLFIVLFLLRHVLFLGFAPFVRHRPDVIKKILEEINPEPGAIFCSIGYDRSGFLEIAEKKFPQCKFIGFDNSIFGYLLCQLQLFFKKSRIKVVNSDYYKADISKAGVVYCYLDPEELRELYKKLKIEPKSDAIVISVGFIIPYLDPLKILKTEPKKKWYGFLSQHKKFLTIKEKEHTRDNNIYFYQV